MPYVYILYSKQIDGFYIGFTTTSVELRIQKHLEHFYGYKYTQRVEDWELFHSIECNSEAQGRSIEAHIKKMKSKKYIQNLKVYPEIQVKLIQKYKDF